MLLQYHDGGDDGDEGVAVGQQAVRGRGAAEGPSVGRRDALREQRGGGGGGGGGRRRCSCCCLAPRLLLLHLLLDVVLYDVAVIHAAGGASGDVGGAAGAATGAAGGAATGAVGGAAGGIAGAEAGRRMYPGRTSCCVCLQTVRRAAERKWEAGEPDVTQRMLFSTDVCGRASLPLTQMGRKNKVDEIVV